MSLYKQSIQVILQNQADSGAYVASPNCPPYAHCWLRDGSFIAYAMNLVGQHDSAGRFLSWVDRTIRRYAWKVDRLLVRIEEEKPIEESDYLHTRYTLEGEEVDAQWPNFQLDGYGAWLWALAQHVRMTRDWHLLEELKSSIDVTLRYLRALWMVPNYDCWEENRDKVHISTLAAIYGGLDAISHFHPQKRFAEIQGIRDFVLQKGVKAGHLVKYVGTDIVDSSLLFVSTPFRLLQPDDGIMQATVEHIEDDLHCNDGGIHRYVGDTYYGGGEWTLLAAWLGWYYAEVGEYERARKLLSWVEAQADDQGNLPEQVSDHLLTPKRYSEWEARWGPIAKPLLWSHAMYLILYHAVHGAE